MVKINFKRQLISPDIAETHTTGHSVCALVTHFSPIFQDDDVMRDKQGSETDPLITGYWEDSSVNTR